MKGAIVELIRRVGVAGFTAACRRAVLRLHEALFYNAYGGLKNQRGGRTLLAVFGPGIRGQLLSELAFGLKCG